MRARWAVWLIVIALLLSGPSASLAEYETHYGSLTVTDDLSAGDDLTVDDNADISGRLAVAESLRIMGVTTIHEVDLTGDLSVSDSLYVGTVGVFADSLYVADDMVIHDDLTVDGEIAGSGRGALVFTGGATFGGEINGTTAVFSGEVQVEHLSSTDDASVADSLYVGDDIVCVDDITCADLTASGTVQGEHLYSTDDAVVADSLYVGDDLTVVDDCKVSGEMQGGRMLLNLGDQTSGLTADQWLRGAGKALTSATYGLVMPRDGSIVGASLCVITNTHGGLDGANATLDYEIYVNGVEVYALSWEIDADEVHLMYDTQARGEDTFSAGDFVSVYIDIADTVNYSYPQGLIEVQFDD